jgi:hypothetical protein
MCVVFESVVMVEDARDVIADTTMGTTAEE